jgi:hypothetical protein
LVLGSFAFASDEKAALELQTHLKEAGGTAVEIIRTAPGKAAEAARELRARKMTPILLGKAAEEAPPSEWFKTVKLTDPSAYALEVQPEMIAIRGGSPRGVICGVMEALEQTGFRWFFPGALGTVTPSQDALKLVPQQKTETPGFTGRWAVTQNHPEWMERVKMGGAYFPSAHGIDLGKGGSFAENPNLYALVKGERNKVQVCLSNPETVKRATDATRDFFKKNPSAPWMGLGPNDGGGFCECEGCVALDGGDWDPLSAGPAVTDRYIWFFNQILEALAPELPEKKLAFYIYHNYMRPPVRFKPHPNIVPALADISLCRYHGPDNPVCPEKSLMVDLIHQWKKLCPEFYERGYWFNLADPGLPFIQTDKIAQEIKLGKEAGVTGWRVEVIDSPAAEGPSLYVGAKLMWNPATDPDAIVADFCNGLFGPAATPMKSYFDLLTRTINNADHHSGSAFDSAAIYTAEVRKEAGGLIDAAISLTKEGSLERKRVEIYQRHLAYTNAFVEMIEARNAHQWELAHQHLAETDRLREILIDPPLLNPRSSGNYMRRFFRLPVEKGFARVSDGNKMIAPLVDDWDFWVDTHNLGLSQGYYRPTLTGGGWQKIKPYSTTWDSNGLRYYKGLAWYRQRVTIPKEHEGKRIFLYFGGVDETAKVWLNGKELGTSPISAFTPFELDATTAVEFGKENTLVVCVSNNQVDELGTGGITAPAFFYAPAKGKDAVLENARPLRATFP